MPESFKNKTVSVVGLGYIGLPTAALFASHGVKVIGVDVNQKAVDTINQGKIHIVEPGLENVVKDAVLNGSLKAVTKPEPADAFLVAVPTPFKNDHEPDMAYIEAASHAIAPVLKKGDLIILESTSPVGATEQMAAWLAADRPDLSFPQNAGEESDVRIAHCPERVLPGHVMDELVANDRVIGGLTEKCSELAARLYKTFVQGECFITTARTAEMCKLTENSFRDINIAFANELSLICKKLDINVWELIKLANRHPRVNILQPGAGVGGHCIAVDPWFIVDKTPDLARMIRTAREVNDGKPDWVVQQAKAAIEKLVQAGKPLSEIKIALLGLAFKPNIDDLRESPAVHIAKKMTADYAGKVLVVEPYIHELPKDISGAQLCNLEQALQQADVVLILVGHNEFKDNRAMLEKHPMILDAVGVLGV